MNLSRSASYAISALVHIAAQPDGRLCAVHEISARRGIPVAFLEKILQLLRRRGLLRSVRGIGGGYQLAVPAHLIGLLEVLELFGESAESNQCLLRLQSCSENEPCLLHDHWSGLRRQFLERLSQTTVADLAADRRRHGEAA